MAQLTRHDLDAAERLRSIWAQHPGLAQTEVAAKIGVAQSMLSRVLAGKMPLTADMTLKLAHFFNVKPSDIRPDLPGLHQQVNEGVLREVLQVIEQTCREAGIDVPPDKRAALVARVYVDAIEQGQVDRAGLRAAIKFAL